MKILVNGEMVGPDLRIGDSALATMVAAIAAMRSSGVRGTFRFELTAADADAFEDALLAEGGATAVESDAQPMSMEPGDPSDVSLGADWPESQIAVFMNHPVHVVSGGLSTLVFVE